MSCIIHYSDFDDLSFIDSNNILVYNTNIICDQSYLCNKDNLNKKKTSPRDNTCRYLYSREIKKYCEKNSCN